MTHDNLTITVATGTAGNLGLVENKTSTWVKLRARLAKPMVDTKTTYAEYCALKATEAGPLKKAAGFWLGGPCKNGERNLESVIERTVLCLDIDEVHPASIALLQMGMGNIAGYEWFAHTTRKHCAEKPRWRVILPLLNPIEPRKFDALCRIIASQVFEDETESIDAVDDVSFRVAQMMYWPSVCSDGEFDTIYNPGDLIDGEAVLEAFGDWENPDNLPFSDLRSRKRPTEYGKKAEDPTLKGGIIGAFCRTYDVEQAIAKYLPRIYIKSKKRSRKPRYTYALGEGAEGAIVEDGGLFLYSNHGSDPCAERSTNAFDLVRIHLFGAQDVGVASDTSPTHMPSFQIMENLARGDQAVAKEEERAFAADLDDAFEDLPGDEEGASESRGTDDFGALLGGETEAKDPFEEDHAVEDDTGVSDVPGWVAKLNKKHAIAFIEGKTVVLTKKANGAMAYGSVTDLHNFYENKRRATEKSTEAVTKAWMRHPDRASYPNGVIFAPSGGSKGAYNHWTGFSVKPDASKSCDLFLSHMRDMICGGNDMAYQWMIRWFAHMIQKPGEKPGTAIVLKGSKGTGKDTVGDYIGGLFPRHHTKIANAEHMLGRFNSHQEQTLLLHVEEGFWAGDKKAEGALKHITTSEQVLIEPKGVNAFSMPSVLRIFISTNEDWAVPASFDERRFFVMSIAGRKREASYYADLRHEMKNGGREALLHHLQSISLRGFDVRNPPMTQGLRDQKIQTLKNVDKWWFEMLSTEELPSASTGFEDDSETSWEKNYVRVPCALLRETYEKWMMRHRFEGGLLNEADFGKRLKLLLPDLNVIRPRVSGTKRVRTYEIAPLPEARRQFEDILGLEVDWPESGDEDDPGDDFDLG